MNRIKYFFTIPFLSYFSLVIGQNSPIYQFPGHSGSKDLSINDCFSGRNYPMGPNFIEYPSDTKLAYMESFLSPNRNIIYTFDPQIGLIDSSNRTELVNVTAVSNALNKIQSKLPEYSDISKRTNYFPMGSLQFDNENEGWFENDNHIYKFSIINKDSVTVEYLYKYANGSAAVETKNFCKNKDCIKTAFVSDYNLWIASSEEALQITSDGDDGIVYGQSVHRNEFGINGGLFWSPKGNSLAFYRMDETRVTKYPIFSITPRPAIANQFRYPMAGDSSHTVSIGVYNIRKHNLVYLKTEGPYDQYLTNVTWSPDEKYIYVAWVNRDQNEMQLRKYNSQTGDLEETLFTHTHPKYIEPEHGPLFIPGCNDEFIWQSEIDGYNHLYYYKKGVLKQITKGNWIITNVLGFANEGKDIIVESTKAGENSNALNRMPLLINLKSKQILELSTFKGNINTQWFANSTNLMMSISNLNSNEGKIATTFISLPIEKNMMSNATLPTSSVNFQITNPVSEFNIGKIEISKIQNQGYDLYTRMFYPPNFDPSKKYPVVVYLYGGPHAQMVANSWLGGGNLWMAYMASKGYIVFTLDNRGSANRGLEFENAIHRQVGTIEMSDQLKGVDYLKTLSFVDSNRIGIHGWSFGGFMTTSLMTRTPGVFKVGVAGGPVIDWSYYEVMYTERYMDRPDENPEGYKKNSLLQYAKNLEGNLLMIHGADDDVVVWQHSLMFVDECVKNLNTNIDYFVYPGHKHNVRGKDRIHLYKKISEYFFDKL